MDLNDLASDLFGSKRAESSTQPSTVSVMYGIATSDSADGLVSVWLSDNALSPTDAQAQWETVDSYDADAYEGMDESTSIEIPTEVTCFKDDVVRVQLTGAGAAKNPTVVGVVGRGDEQNQRLGSIEADYIKATELEADVAQIGFLKADSAVITNLQADTAKVHNLTADQLTAATAFIADLNAASITAQTLTADVAKVHNLTADQISAAAAYISALKADSIEATNISAMYGDFDTVKANAAKVANLNAQQLTAAVGYINDLTSASVTAQNLAADHATIGSLDTNYARADLVNANVAWLQNGLIKDASISDAKIIGVSANKLTAGTIDAAEINVMNLRADNLKVSRVNGQPVLGGYSLVDPSGSGYASKNPKTQGWYELTANGYVLTDDTTVVSGKAYYTTSTSVELYDQDYIDGLAEDLSDRIDGAIETFTSSAVPTPNNYPASDWTTDDVRATHVGDVCYVLNEASDSDGWCYRYAYDSTTHQYGWVLIKDSDVTKALYELTDPNGELKTFETQTSTWKTATDNEITSIKSSQTSLETRTGNLETNKVDVGTFNSVSQKVDANEASITRLGQTVEQKADSSTVTTISNTVNTVKQTADSNTAAISSLTQTVETKADGSTVTALSERTSSIEEDLDGITTTVGRIDSEIETVSNPNLSPFFSINRTDGTYWHTIGQTVTDSDTRSFISWSNAEGLHSYSDLEGEWAHFTLDARSSAGNTGGNNYFNIFLKLGKLNVEEGKTYTWLMEVRNANITGGILRVRPSIGNATLDKLSDVGTSKTFSGDGAAYAIVTAKTDFSSVTQDSRGYLYVASGVYAEFDLRLSLYEGEYSGPYKPYVDQTLSNRVKSAETSITQNANAIELRATKTEAYQLSQPNLSPYFDVPKTDSSYWKRVQTNAQFTTYDMQVEHNGSGAWAHLAGNATSGNPFVRFEPMPLVTIKPSTKYTFTIDIDTVSTASSITSINLQLASGKANSDAFDPFSTSLSFAAKGKTGTYYVIGTTRADISDSMVLSRSYLQVYGTGTFDIYIRLSLYEGEYAGPYKPYVGAKLYASQAELKIANDAISTKVEKDGVISSINQSAESITINANRVNIEGATIFTSGRLSSTSLNNAYDAKGAASTVQANLNNLQIGGRNLLLGTSDSWSEWVTPTANTNNWTKYWYISKNDELLDWATAGQSVTFSMDIEFSGVTKSSSGTFKVYSQDCFKSVSNGGMDGSNNVDWNIGAAATALELLAPPADGIYTFTKTISFAATHTTRYALLFSIRADYWASGQYRIRRVKYELGNKATDWTPAPEDQTAYVDESVSSVQIGGRNLVLGTADWSKWLSSSGATISGDEITYSANDTNNRLVGVAVVPGDTYTISMDIRADSAYTYGTSGNTFLLLDYGTSGEYERVGYAWAFYGTSLTTEWQRVAETFTVPTTDTLAKLYVSFRNTGGSNQPTYHVRHLKVERGNKATDWTPAPEDVEANTLASGIEYINGTQTAATNLWTGVTKETALVTGKTIAYKLPYAGNSTAATLNLTLAGGGTTGAKAVKQIYATDNNTGKLADVTTHWPVGSIIQMTYDGTRWVISNYNTNVNTNDNARYIQYYNNIVAGEALHAASIIGGRTDGKFYELSGSGDYFDLSHPILWLTAALAKDAVDYSHIYIQTYSRTFATYYTSFTSGTANSVVYLVGTVSGNTFTLYGSTSDTYLTCTPPSTEDGRFYIPIGRLGDNSDGKNYFNYQVSIPVSLYAYLDGKFRQVTPTEIVASQRIYWRTDEAGYPTAPTGNASAWVTDDRNVYGSWTTKVPPLSDSTNAGVTKYLYLYTCEQRKRLDGTVECTPVTLDENTTIIDGGSIITHSITAEQIAAHSITAEQIDASELNIGISNVAGLKATLDGIAEEGELRAQWVRIDESGVEVGDGDTGTKVAAGEVDFIVNGNTVATAGIDGFNATSMSTNQIVFGDYAISESNGIFSIDYIGS